MAEDYEEVPCYKLTTIDNPFNPVYEYQQWKRFDEDHGYFTESYMGRAAGTSIYLSDAENQRIENDTIDDAIRLHRRMGINIYKKVLID